MYGCVEYWYRAFGELGIIGLYTGLRTPSLKDPINPQTPKPLNPKTPKP